MISSLTAAKNRYIDYFPYQVPAKMAQGFAATAMVRLISGSALNVLLIAGSFSAAVTLIEAVARPVIRSIFPEHSLIAHFLIGSYLIVHVLYFMDATMNSLFAITCCLVTSIALNHKFYENNVGLLCIC